MRFERGKDPKKTMDIGIGVRSVHLSELSERDKSLGKDPYGLRRGIGIYYKSLNSSIASRILEDIQKNGIQERHKKYWTRKWGNQGYVPIEYMEGEWVEYLKKYYYIPHNHEL